MPLGKRQRRVLLGLGIFLAAVAVLLVALPLWLPWLMRPIAARNGARYAHYERVGYRRFAVEGVVFTNDAIRFRAERLEGLVPSVRYRLILSPSRK